MRKPLIIATLVALTGALLVSFYVFRSTRKIDVAVAEPNTTTIATPKNFSKDISLLFVGDIMLSRQVGDKIAASGDWRYPFLLIGDFLRGADLTFANLEDPVSDRGVRMGSIYSFRADPRTLAGLSYAGIDVVSLANNHMWDYGRDAFLDTMSLLTERGIAYIGAGHDNAEAHRGITKVIKGTRITYLGYTNLYGAQLAATQTAPGLAIYDHDEMVADIAAARAVSDIVIVSFHAGTEYETHHNAEQEQIYTSAIDAGADLVIGHHPHVVQEVTQYKKGWIAYSLGNFVFDQYFSKETMEGLAVRATIHNGKISNVTTIPVGINANSQALVK